MKNKKKTLTKLQRRFIFDDCGDLFADCALCFAYFRLFDGNKRRWRLLNEIVDVRNVN